MRFKRLTAMFTASVMALTMVTAASAEDGIGATEICNTECAESLTIEKCAINIKNIYKANYPEEEKMIDDIVDTISSSSEFIYCFNTEGATAFQIIEDSLRDALVPTISPYFYSEGVYRLSKPVPAIMQEKDYYCGPASVLQALDGNGVRTSSDTQDSIAAALGTDSSGTYITNISAYMRQRCPAKNGYEYKAKAFTCYTYENALELVKTSLQKNAVPIIRIPDTSVLTYYDGLSQTHYVCVSQVDMNEGTVTLSDPNNTSYDLWDRHDIPISEFEALVNYDGWIVLYTNASNGYYVYE